MTSPSDMRKPSIKKHIQPGALIRVDRSFYQVLELGKSTFTCRLMWCEHEGYEQTFYYNIDMEVYQLIASKEGFKQPLKQ